LPGTWVSIGRDAGEEPTGLWLIEPRAPMATRSDLEEIVPSRDGIGQEKPTA
jgi:hypothetical protein